MDPYFSRRKVCSMLYSSKNPVLYFSSNCLSYIIFTDNLMKLYWTHPRSNIGADGKIFYALIDSKTPVAVSLVSAISQVMINSILKFILRIDNILYLYSNP